MKELLKKSIVFLLTLETRATLKKYHPHIVAITGSVGKTSTKDAIFTALAASLHVRKSEKSFNSELGVPLTILGLHNGWANPIAWFRNLYEGLLLVLFRAEYPEWLVLEVGADRPGDIQTIASWLAPDVVVMTRFPDVPVHVEFFDSPEEVIQEKRALIGALREDGILVLNADDERMQSETTRARTIVRFGFGPRADIRGANDRVRYHDGVPVGMDMKVEFDGKSMPLSLTGALGRHHLYPLLAACAVSQALGLNTVEVLTNLSKHSTPPGRMKLLAGKKGSTIIDDTYNASPIAVNEALTALAQVETKGRKIVALADMLELGEFSSDMHKEAGRHAARVADYFFTVGVRARAAAEAAITAGLPRERVTVCEDSRALGALLADMVQDGDIALIKGSQSMRMERAVEAVLADPSKKRELLVRQDEEWEKR